MASEILSELNPHPAGQQELNAPKDDELTGNDTTMAILLVDVLCQYKPINWGSLVYGIYINWTNESQYWLISLVDDTWGSLVLSVL